MEKIKLKKVLILGSTGMLGHVVYSLLNKVPTFKLMDISYKDKLNPSTIICDVTNTKKLETIFLTIKPDIIINCIGVLIQGTFKSVERAIFLNAYFPHWLKNICDGIQLSEFKSKLIHFSTDQMYNNEKLNDEKNSKIRNFYTSSKIKSEKLALKIDSIILRTNFFGKSLTKKRASFSDWIYYSIKNNNKIHLADDIYFSPISIDRLIKIVLKILDSNHKGIFNIGSKNGFSKYQFGYLFAKIKYLDSKYIIKVKKDNLRFLAKRNNDMRMQLNKFEKVFQIKLPNLINELKYIAKMYY